VQEDAGWLGVFGGSSDISGVGCGQRNVLNLYRYATDGNQTGRFHAIILTPE
jgi:hypothetical protein